MKHASLVIALVRLVTLVAVLRFVLPLFTTRLGVFSIAPDLLGTASWIAVFWTGRTLFEVIPAFIKHALPAVEEVMQADRRKPVLYLRSFEKELKRVARMRWTQVARNYTQNVTGFYYTAHLPGDSARSSRGRMSLTLNSYRTPFDEQIVLAEALERIGPYIAIGRPNENFKNMDLGASKKYVADDEWQSVVCQWLLDSAAVLLEAGDSAGLGWEIEQVVRIVAPTHVLLVCPYTDDEYESFTRTHGSRFPKSLPKDRPESRLLTFDRNWTPWELPFVDGNASSTLAPFFSQIGSTLRIVT